MRPNQRSRPYILAGARPSCCAISSTDKATSQSRRNAPSSAGAQRRRSNGDAWLTGRLCGPVPPRTRGWPRLACGRDLVAAAIASVQDEPLHPNGHTEGRLRVRAGLQRPVKQLPAQLLVMTQHRGRRLRSSRPSAPPTIQAKTDASPWTGKNIAFVLKAYGAAVQVCSWPSGAPPGATACAVSPDNLQ